MNDKSIIEFAEGHREQKEGWGGIADRVQPCDDRPMI